MYNAGHSHMDLHLGTQALHKVYTNYRNSTFRRLECKRNTAMTQRECVLQNVDWEANLVDLFDLCDLTC